MPYIAATPKPPYYAVIFTSINASVDHAEHAKMFPGFLGIEGSRNGDGTGVTAVYWSDLESIHAWAKDPMHQAAKVKGRELWYSHWMIRICKVEREYGRTDQ